MEKGLSTRLVRGQAERVPRRGQLQAFVLVRFENLRSRCINQAATAVVDLLLTAKHLLQALVTRHGDRRLRQ